MANALILVDAALRGLIAQNRLSGIFEVLQNEPHGVLDTLRGSDD